MTSHLYSFLDDAHNLNAHFLEGTALIQELEEKHIFTDAGKAYFEHCLLSCLPLVSFLKYGESLGIYFDSEDPYFRFKIELNAYGKVRALLLPENFNACPLTFSGQVRLAKIMAPGQRPYTSVLEIKQLPISEVINQILTQSYQAPAKVLSSPAGFQSMLWHKVPLKVLQAP
ncbi:MAG: Hsp33 family molecular chaperone HslO, partial [Bacteriovoracaceae bacterium]|nr:Hsp33 family molecular chaperone HslO [Bacteriovoracaceae bacterium]